MPVVPGPRFGYHRRMDPRRLDLNLLVVFHHLMLTRRVSAAAEALGVTQPAVSNALKRLRGQLGDALFLRTSHGMEPTPYAQSIAGPVADALEGLRAGLSRDVPFDPAATTRTVSIAMTDIGEIYFLPGLMEALAGQAPGMRVSTVRDAAGTLKAEMEAGRVDLAIGLLPQLQAGFYTRHLFRQRYVCLMRRGHPLDGNGLSLEAFSAADHVVVIAAGTGHGDVDILLDRAGIGRNVRLRVPHFVAIGHILAATDMIATVPERLAERLTGPFGLRALAHPAPLPEIAISLFWHAKVHGDPANQWLRRLIVARFADDAPSPPTPPVTIR